MKLSDSTSEAMLSSILEIAADAIVVIDSDQRIRLFSQAAERTFGYRAEEALGRPLELILPTWAAAKHSAHIHGLVSGRRHPPAHGRTLACGRTPQGRN